jgi:hypothetical protein
MSNSKTRVSLALMLLLAVAAFLCGGWQQGRVIGGGVIGPASGGGGGPTFTYVGGNKANCHTTTTCAVSYPPTAGNLVTVDVQKVDTNAAQPPSLTTDNSSSTYVNEFASGQDPTGNFYFSEDVSLSIGSGVTTITANLGTSPVSSTVIVSEYHRTSGTWSFNAASALLRVTTASTSQTCNSITPTGGNPTVVSGMFYTAVGEDAFLGSGSYTLRESQADIYSGNEAGVTSQIVTSASGTYAAAATNGTSVTYECYTVAYQ